MISLKGRAYQHIRRKLLSGELRAGMTLSPNALAREIEISQTPVREAIAQLESLGLVETLPRLGAVVRRAERYDLEEMIDLREIVETGAVRLAAQNAGQREIDSICGLCQDFLQLGREIRAQGLTHYDGTLLDRLAAMDEGFHGAIINAARNRRLSRLSEDLRLVTYVMDHGRGEDIPGVSVMGRMARAYRGHWRIARALRQRDADAAEQAMRQHLQWAKRLHLSLFDWRRRQKPGPIASGGMPNFPEIGPGNGT